MPIYRVHFPVKGGLRLSPEDSIDETAVSFGSDAFKSALFTMHHVLNDLTMEESFSFFNQFQLSSCFPFAVFNDQTIFFYPKPQLPTELVGSNDNATKNKKIKKIAWIDEGIFKNALKTRSVTINSSYLINGFALSKSAVSNRDKNMSVFSKSMDTRLDFSDTQLPANPDSQNHKAFHATPFEVERIFFSEGCGLHFFLKCEDSFLEETIKPSLRLLADSGIGADRSSGGAFFDYSEVQINKLDHDQNKMFQRRKVAITLGNFIPSLQDTLNIQWSESHYQINSIGGYSYSQRGVTPRKKINAIAPMSILTTNGALQGNLANLKLTSETEHPIFRDGRSLNCYFD